MATLPAQDTIALEMFEAAAAEKAQEKPRTYLGMSAIGDPCERKLWLGFRGFAPKSVEGRGAMIFDLGHCVEDRVVHWLTAAGYRVEGQQEGFTAHGGFFRGHCDGIIHGVTQRPHVLEIKSANARKFKMFRDSGVQKTSPTYWCQAQCYMGYANLDRALFVIQCKDNSDIYTERVYFQRDAFDALHARAAGIIHGNDVPPRSFDQESFECKWCDYSIQCWTPDMALQTRQVCGCCDFCLWIDGAPWCGHPAHHFELQQWGIRCDDWTLRNVEQRRSVPTLPPEELAALGTRYDSVPF